MVKHKGHSFLGVMSVFIFLALLANLLTPWLPLEWRHRLSPSEEGSGQVSLPQESLPVSQYATKSDLQDILNLIDSLKVATSHVDSLKTITSPMTSQYLTPEDLDLFEQRLAERLVTVEHLEELLRREAYTSNKVGRSLPSSQVTIVVPAPPMRPLPHPLPGRQF
jgi:hypothetical protein